MNAQAYILIIAASVWMTIEGGLILRDMKNSKGSTRADRMTRWFNIVSISTAVLSPLVSFALPILQFNGAELPIVTWTGAVVICLGFILRYWSIAILGKHFRTTVEIEKGHTIVRKGPYKLIRHPSYSGIILFCTGYGMVSQNWLSLALCILLPALALIYRIKIEEEAFLAEIGDDYRRYQARTKKLIPGIW
jgi:protein-S-isoprenylcysteine O-methyltransferase Ste14